MITSTIYSDTSFDEMLPTMQAHFDRVIAENEPHLFQVETDEDLYQIYLDNLPAEQRQHHTCRCCQNFIRRFGSLGSITADGVLVSPIWALEDVPPLYLKSFYEMSRAVKRGKIVTVALFKDDVWGTPHAGEWTHFNVRPKPEMIFKHALLTAGQAMAAKREDHGTLCRGLAEFPHEVVSKAALLLEADTLYRGEKVIGPVRFLLSLHNEREIHAGRRENITWRAVAYAPPGFCQPRSTMIGTLLEDIANGFSFDDISRRFKAKMDPLQYQRPQSAPSAGNIEQAEKVIAQMGLESALKRRFARLEEIKTIWLPKPEEQPKSGGGVFGHLKPKDAHKSQPLNLPAQAITWEKFARTVLPTAEKIEIYLSGLMNLCAITTAADPNSKPILQWDSEQDRNPFSVYVYHDGSRPERWNLVSGTWAKVTGICLNPSMWSGCDKFSHQGKNAIFILDRCVDKDSTSLALFPETLRSELHSIRATIEAFSRSRQLEGRLEASACGLAIGNLGSHATIQITTAIGVTAYKIDRWD